MTYLSRLEHIAAQVARKHCTCELFQNALRNFDEKCPSCFARETLLIAKTNPEVAADRHRGLSGHEPLTPLEQSLVDAPEPRSTSELLKWAYSQEPISHPMAAKAIDEIINDPEQPFALTEKLIERRDPLAEALDESSC